MTFDTIILGAGQAAPPLATKLAAAGERVLLVERRLVGGTCVNYGCTPTKTMIASARAAHVARTAGRLGVEISEVRVDLAAVVDRKEAVVRQWREGVEESLEAVGDRLRILRGHGRFSGEREVEVEGERYRAGRVIIDVGARPAIPPISGLAETPWLDNASIMELRELPKHLIILGGGYIGCEFAQMFRRFGARVTILNRGQHLLGREDPEISSALEEVFREEGITLEMNREVEAVSGWEGDVVARAEGGEEVRGSHILVALGRTPNTDDLGCDAAGIALDEKGHVRIDDHYRTTAEGVYAVGDVTGGPQFTHASWDDHRILLDLLRRKGDRNRSDRIIPYTVFTDPQVARVGLSEREAREQEIAHEVASMPFEKIARAIESDERAGFMKVLIDPETERILGAAITGAQAGELIHVFSVLMQAGASARAMVDAEFVHPTFAEGLHTLVRDLDRYA